jgi:hypothetical protein
MAQSGRARQRLPRQLSGVKRTLRVEVARSAYDPKRTAGPFLSTTGKIVYFDGSQKKVWWVAINCPGR